MSRFIGWIFAVLGLVALVAAGIWLTRPEEAGPDNGGRPPFVVPVVLANVERSDLVPRALLSGTVRASRRARLGFDTSGIISALDVEEADVVDAGSRLAAVENGDEAFELAAAEASLARAEREQDLLIAGEREEQKRRLFAALEAARAEAKLTKLEFDRGTTLLEDGLIPQSEQDRRDSAFDAADKRRAAAEEEYDLAVAGTRPEDLAIAAARVSEAVARVNTAKHDLGKTELFAPWPGAIIERFVSIGDHVSEGDPVYELVDLENLEVHIEVPGRFAPHIGPSSRVRLELARRSDFAIERPLDATIPAADAASRGFRAIVRLNRNDDPRGLLKPGMFVEVELLLERIVDALVLPSDCVLANERGTYLVRAIEAPADAETPGLVADFVPVRVLAEVDGLSAIESLGPPLDPGDSIVIVGGDNAFPGATLVPREPPAGTPQAAQAAGREGGRGVASE